jgi:cytochrome c biogenesis protein
MATTQSEANVGARADAPAQAGVKIREKKRETILDKILALLSSVKFGVVMLMILLTCSIIGMLIVQTVEQDFHKYYSKLTASQQMVYGALDLFDIYHSWYFDLLLSITGLNIILASIDRFPTAWQYVWKPKLKASPNFIRAQTFNTEAEVGTPVKKLAEEIKSAWRRRGFRAKVSEDNGRVTVFAQRNVWNRLGAYFVHVALLTIFTGGFLTNRYGVGGQMPIEPGVDSQTFSTLKVTADGDQTGMARLPFVVECTDLQQQLVDNSGTLEQGNTVDWFTTVRLVDSEKNLTTKPVKVHLNEPYDYRGYRFFQSSFAPRGYARSITVKFVPVAGGQASEATIPRGEQVDVPGIGRVSYTDFFPDFTVTNGKPDTEAVEFTGYNKPVALLKIVGPDNQARGAFAVNEKMADQFYSQDSGADKGALLVNGNRVLLSAFEKVGISHTLTVQYDPGRTPVYIGFSLLIVALCGVFLFSHQRIWAVLEPQGDSSKAFLGGNTNRNKPAFEARFNSLVESVVGRRETKNE